MTEINDWPTEPIAVTDGKFEETIQMYPLVVVDCWAPWCAPCHIIAPIVEELAKEYQGKIVFGKLNMDENQETAMRYNIMSIPTLLIFKSGKLVDQSIGAMPKEMLEPQITIHL
jgi:thioredoxin 1